MTVLLLLSVCVSIGLADYPDHRIYGESFRMKLHRRAEYIEFRPQDSSHIEVVWRRSDNNTVNVDSRWQVKYGDIMVKGLTQRDSGSYTMRDKDGRTLPSTLRLEVEAFTMDLSLDPEESMHFESGLRQDSCNIVWFPSNTGERIDIVVGGQRTWNPDSCNGYKKWGLCGLSKDHVGAECSGHYEVRDNNDNLAYVVNVDVMVPQDDFEASNTGIGVGVLLSSIFCSCCIKCCCCRKKSKKDEAETPDDSPVVPHYQEYDNEPVGPRQDHLSQPSERLYPAQPSYPPTVPLIHNPAPACVPPTYSQVHNPLCLPPAYSEVVAPAEQADVLTVPVPVSVSGPVPVSSDPGPRFELSVPCAPPLSDDSNFCHVYTSDKLNFL